MNLRELRAGVCGVSPYTIDGDHETVINGIDELNFVILIHKNNRLMTATTGVLVSLHWST